VASKPRSEWTEAYRRRIERAEARGKSHQQARGHVAKEHVVRREHERAEVAKHGGLTSPQRAAIRKFAAAQAVRMGEEREDVQESMLAYSHNHGWSAFEAVRDRQRELRSDWKRQGRPYGQGRGVKFLQNWSDFHDDADIGWLYYH
jgi:hypothetical protein